MIQRLSAGLFLAASLVLPKSGAFAATQPTAELMRLVVEACETWDETTGLAPTSSFASAQKSPVEVRNRIVGSKFRLLRDNNSLLELAIIDAAGPQAQFIGTAYNASGRAFSFISMASECHLQTAKRIEFDLQGHPLKVVTLDSELNPVGNPDWLNPPLEFIDRGTDKDSDLTQNPPPAPLRVALVDSGVNYRLAQINRRLARDNKGELVGYDYWDMDKLPYDAHPLRSEFFIQRHGTRTASLLLQEAPGIELVAYRYPRPDMSRMKALVDHAHKNRVSIIGMPLGSNRAEEWHAFEQAARAHPDILFVISAGNNGRDIDQHPVYPAALDLDNSIVVTSADDYVQPAERTNWGRQSVDYLIPAENLQLLDYTGKLTLASGSSYAVSRMTALAARLKMGNPDWIASDIKTELHRRYGKSQARRWVSSGYIADPLAGKPILKESYPGLAVPDVRENLNLRLPLNILVLDSAWTHERVEDSVQTAYRILAQCDIGVGAFEVHAINADDYLRDLSTGTARTLLEAAGSEYIDVLLARDTRMQEPFSGEAFGIDNTNTRPWLVNSVWIMPDIGDAGKALAHELFHVIANSGEHREEPGNLMQSRTRPDSQQLSVTQCELARSQGLANGLLHTP